MAQTEHVHEESIRGLMRGILSDLRTLIREELAMARVEMRENAGRARSAAFAFGIAAAALACGGIFILVAAAAAVADLLEWPLWAGFLVVAVALGIVGLATLVSGRQRLRELHAVPRETISTLKENSEWIAKRLSSARK
jgi:hypothetical protein